MKKSILLLKVVVAVIFLLAAIGMFMIATAGESNSPEMASAANFVVLLAQGLLYIATGLAVLSSIYSIFNSDGKALRNKLIGFGIFLAIFAISYVFAGSEQVLGANGKVLIESKDFAATSKWTGTGLIFSYILLTIGGLFFVWDLLKSLIKS